MRKLTVAYPEDVFKVEREYVLSLFLRDFLTIKSPVFFQPGKIEDYEFSYGGKKLIVRDFFFKNRNNYLNVNVLPDTYTLLNLNSFSEIISDLVVILGKPQFEKQNNKIILSADIFGSSFFLLSRLEEAVSDKKDKFDRFPDKENFLVKNNLHHRPVVNEYVAFFKELLMWLGVDVGCKFNYTPVITHDVDILRRFTSPVGFVRNFMSDVFKYKNPFLQVSAAYLKYLTGLKPDPFDSFDYLMSQSEKYGLKSRFYFIPSLKSEPKAFYYYNDKRAVSLVKHILERGHIVGLHGSFRAYNNEEIFLSEIRRFEQAYGFKPKEGRQHFLRFQVPETWRIWDSAGLQTDSSMGFTTTAGFRAGICYPYRVFDVKQRKMLKINELPLVFMDTALISRGLNLDEYFNVLKELVSQVKKYNGFFVLLWHNSTFETGIYWQLGKHYEDVLKIVAG